MIINPYRFGGVPNAYQNYRLDISATYGGGTIQIAEISAYDNATNLINLLSGSTATAVSSNGTNTPDRVLDGNTSTNWQISGTNTSGWIQFALGSTISPAALAITRASASTAGAPSTFAWQGGATGSGPWTDIYVGGDEASWGSDAIFVIPLFAEAWRIRINAAQDGGALVNVTEFSARDSGGANLFTSGLAFASSNSQGAANGKAAKLFDGNTSEVSSYWQNSNVSNQIGGSIAVFAGIILPNGINLNPADFQLSNGGTPGKSPANIAIERWKYNTGWQTVISQSGVSWTANQTKTFTV